MRKIIIGLATAVVVFGACSAEAQQRHGHYNGGGHQHRGGGGWVVPLVGGMVLGGVLYGLSQPSYAAPQPQYQRTCGYEPVYDMYGRYMGDRRVCNTIPIY
ncbi:hypothetical protein UFOVP245_36 [uncultured Caudovirales phage]|uniref:Uncharacterized protein n=1 Tax=uncultured Caudovirales phage TaxID=2100421 RepID=A0A6J7WSV4_9CAUD|nr:hypothetical protein UFOVP245_36 [uncultured Caudovirales phage]